MHAVKHGVGGRDSTELHSVKHGGGGGGNSTELHAVKLKEDGWEVGWGSGGGLIMK